MKFNKEGAVLTVIVCMLIARLDKIILAMVHAYVVIKKANHNNKP
ncbi:hypothetical protein [Limosilactobacillus gastricus]|nr:hypothetical protein [Limosilactobacillus gastricus]